MGTDAFRPSPLSYVVPSQSFSPQQAHKEEIYIYCMILPGFECHTKACQTLWPSTPVVVHPSQGGIPFIQRRYMYVDLDQLLLQRSLPQYTIVKVGISVNPADRLTDIMRSFEEFGAHNAHFQNLDENDTVDKCKQEASIIFLKKCYDVKRNVEDAEVKIRKLLGRELGPDFQDQFTSSLDYSKHQHVSKVGKTEWILIETGRMKRIQEHFRHNGIACIIELSVMGKSPTGGDVYKQLGRIVNSHNLGQQRFRLPQVDHNVEIKFTPTGFTFPIGPIRPPY